MQEKAHFTCVVRSFVRRFDYSASRTSCAHIRSMAMNVKSVNTESNHITFRSMLMVIVDEV